MHAAEITTKQFPLDTQLLALYKAGRVYGSCQTLAQYRVAMTYLNQLRRIFGFSDESFFKNPYFISGYLSNESPNIIAEGVYEKL